jgi:hypothetical protein
MVRVETKGSYGTSSRLRTHVVGLRVVSKTEIEQSRSGATREIMTCTNLTMTNPFGVTPQ